MGYFDALVEASFKPDDEGRELFFPWGFLTRGLVVPSEDHARRLRTLLKWHAVLGGLVAFGLFLMGQWWLLLAFLIAERAVYFVWARSALSTWERSSERLKYREAMRRQARFQSRRLLWFSVVFSSLFAAGSAVLLVRDPGQWELWVGMILLWLFGLAASSWMLVVARRAQDSS